MRFFFFFIRGPYAGPKLPSHLFAVVFRPRCTATRRFSSPLPLLNVSVHSERTRCKPERVGAPRGFAERKVWAAQKKRASAFTSNVPAFSPPSLTDNMRLLPTLVLLLALVLALGEFGGECEGEGSARRLGATTRKANTPPPNQNLPTDSFPTLPFFFTAPLPTEATFWRGGWGWGGGWGGCGWGGCGGWGPRWGWNGGWGGGYCCGRKLLEKQA